MLTRLAVTADGPEKIGSSWYSLDRTAGIDWPIGQGPQAHYQVPTGYKFVGKALTFAVRQGPAQQNWMTVGAAGIVNMGTIRLDIGASQLLEWRLQWPTQPANPGADEMVVQRYNAFQLPSLGHGVVCPSGTQLQVRCTPAAASPMVWTCTVAGMKGGAPYIQRGKLVSGMTAANQTILSVTPDADWTVSSFLVDVDYPAQLLGTASINCAERPAWEAPYLGLEQTSSNMFDDKGYAGPGTGAVTIPLWGITFEEGTRISLTARPYSQDDSVWQLLIAGTEEAVGGGGGGNTYSRGRVVNA